MPAGPGYRRGVTAWPIAPLAAGWSGARTPPRRSIHDDARVETHGAVENEARADAQVAPRAVRPLDPQASRHLLRAQQILGCAPPSLAPTTKPKAAAVPALQVRLFDGQLPFSAPGWQHAIHRLERAARGKSAEQPVRTVDALYAHAAAAMPEFHTIARALAQSVGGTATLPTELKGRPRAEQRIATSFEGHAERLTDLLRGRIAFSSLDALLGAVRACGEAFDVVAVKDRFARPFADGYRDVLLNVRLSNGHVAELQLHLDETLAFADTGSHALYEQARAIFARAKTEGRSLTADELDEVAQLNRRARIGHNLALVKDVLR